MGRAYLNHRDWLLEVECGLYIFLWHVSVIATYLNNCIIISDASLCVL